MNQPATSSSRTLPMGAILCPRCGSPDTPKYKWPADPQSRMFEINHPDTRICVDCNYIWWSD